MDFCAIRCRLLQLLDRLFYSHLKELFWTDSVLTLNWFCFDFCLITIILPDPKNCFGFIMSYRLLTVPCVMKIVAWTNILGNSIKHFQLNQTPGFYCGPFLCKPPSKGKPINLVITTILFMNYIVHIFIKHYKFLRINCKNFSYKLQS